MPRIHTMAAPAIDVPEPGAAATDAGPVDSPTTPSSHDALARFEFESGKGNEGTKILMVEWSTASAPAAAGPASSQDHQGRWEVSWAGKTTKIFAQSERDEGATQRVYFLLPAEAPIPPLITIAQLPAGRTLHAKPMPAIYTPGLGVDASRDAGKRGVLHTIWAKKRLAQLQDEIRREMADNSEGVALVMAVQEQAWIADHFGLVDTTGGSPAATAATSGDAPPTPQSPRSPVGGRLGEKLRGLKLATSPSDLAHSPRRHQPQQQQQHHLYSLSPDTSDIAVPSRSAFAAGAASSRAGGPAAVGSLNAIVDSAKPGLGAPENKETEEDLFVLPMSPRSPEMAKSPFSFL